MADALKSKYPGSDVEFVKGGGGIFDVYLDDRLLFSKHAVGRFPDPGEVFAKID